MRRCYGKFDRKSLLRFTRESFPERIFPDFCKESSPRSLWGKAPGSLWGKTPGVYGERLPGVYRKGNLTALNSLSFALATGMAGNLRKSFCQSFNPAFTGLLPLDW